MKKLQLKIILHHVGATVVFALVVIAATFGPSVVVLLSNETSEPDRLEHADRLLLLHDVFWPMIAVGFVFLLITSVSVSHRIAGPLYRFRVVMDSVSRGKIDSEIKIRPRDFLVDEVRHMNVMLSQLISRITILGQLNHDLVETIELIANDADKVEAVGEDLIMVLVHQAHALDDELRRFQLGEAGVAVPVRANAKT